MAMPQLWRRHGARLLRFGTVGVVNTGLDVALYALATLALGWHPVLANTLSYAAGTLCSFLLNRIWTFADSAPASDARRQFLRFVGVNLATLAIGNLLIAILLRQGVEPLPAKAAAVLLCFLANYAMARRFVFRAAGTALP